MALGPYEWDKENETLAEWQERIADASAPTSKNGVPIPTIEEYNQMGPDDLAGLRAAGITLTDITVGPGSPEQNGQTLINYAMTGETPVSSYGSPEAGVIAARAKAAFAAADPSSAHPYASQRVPGGLGADIRAAEAEYERAANMAHFDQYYKQGTKGGTGVDTAKLAMQQAAIEDTLAWSMEHIASQFKLMTEEMERQKEQGKQEMDSARLDALDSLTKMSADLESTSNRTNAMMASAAMRTGGDIGAATEGALRRLGSTSDVISDGARRAIEEEGQSEVGLAASEAQIQSDLSARLAQITEGQLGRSRGSAEQIAQGGKTAMSASMAALLAQRQADRSGTEFEVSENARQAALELALNPPTRSWGGTAGGRFAGMDLERSMLQELGYGEAEIAALLSSGQYAAVMEDYFNVGGGSDLSPTSQLLFDTQTPEELAAIGTDPEHKFQEDAAAALIR